MMIVWLVYTIRQLSTLIKKGFNILSKSVDHNDTYRSNMICELVEDKDNFVILEDK